MLIFPQELENVSPFVPTIPLLESFQTILQGYACSPVTFHSTTTPPIRLGSVLWSVLEGSSLIMFHRHVSVDAQGEWSLIVHTLLIPLGMSSRGYVLISVLVYSLLKIVPDYVF